MLPPCGKFATPYLLKKIDLLLKSLSVKPNVVVKKVRSGRGSNDEEGRQELEEEACDSLHVYYYRLLAMC